MSERDPEDRSEGTIPMTSGRLVEDRSRPAPSVVDQFQAITISALAHRMSAAGTPVVHMEFGQPSTGAPAAAIARAHEVLDIDSLGYWESQPLKERIARNYRDQGVELDPDRIVLTSGASPALLLALATLFRPGDRIAFARPGYVAYRNVVRTLYMQAVEIGCGPAERFQLTARALEDVHPAPAGVIIASPANPTGTIVSDDEMAALILVCRRRGITIISDEIYHGLSYVGPTRSVLALTDEAVVINSFSKYYSMAGWRLGWLVAPEAIRVAAKARSGNLFLTPPSLAQHAALAAIDSRAELQRHVEGYARNRLTLLDALPALGLSRIAPPDGAFYVYADVGHLTSDSLDLCSRLLRETGVATAPGVDFDPVDGARYMRFSFAVSGSRLDEAIERMIPWFAEQPRIG